MNTSLTITRPVAALPKPARSSILALLEGFFKLLFTTADDPAALRYTHNKYYGEID